MKKGEIIWERIFDRKGILQYIVKSDYRRETYILCKVLRGDINSLEEIGKAKDPPTLHKKFPDASNMLVKEYMKILNEI